MAKVLIDTDIWIDFLNKQDYALNFIQNLSQEHQIYASVLTVTELRAGLSNERAEKYMSIFYAYATIVGVSPRIAESAGSFLKEYKTKGISLGTVDTIIASTAITEKCQLATRNKKDFPQREIRLYPGIETLKSA